MLENKLEVSENRLAIEEFFKPIEPRTYEAFESLSRYVNRGADSKEFLKAFSREHPTLQQSMVRLFLEVIEVVGSPEFGKKTDGRNVWSHKVSKQLLDGFKTQVPENQNDFKPSQWLSYV